MFCVEEFPKDQLFWNSHFHKLPVSEHSKMLKSMNNEKYFLEEEQRKRGRTFRNIFGGSTLH